MSRQFVKEDGKTMFVRQHRYFGKLSAGVYEVGISPQVEGFWYLTALDLAVEASSFPPDGVVGTLLSKVQHFLLPATRKKFEAFGLLYKRGILLHGKPGTGKSTAINHIIHHAVKNNMIVLMNPDLRGVTAVAKQIREIEGNDSRAIMAVWEDIDDQFDNSHSMMQFTNLLDGMSQISNMLFVATTNHIETLPPKLKNRPSRFADVIEVPPPTASERAAFLQMKLDMYKTALPATEIDIAKWVDLTEGLVIDQIKDLMISVYVFEQNLEAAVQLIRDLPLERRAQMDKDLGDYDDGPL